MPIFKICFIYYYYLKHTLICIFYKIYKQIMYVSFKKVRLLQKAKAETETKKDLKHQYKAKTKIGCAEQIKTECARTIPRRFPSLGLSIVFAHQQVQLNCKSKLIKLGKSMLWNCLCFYHLVAK